MQQISMFDKVRFAAAAFALVAIAMVLISSDSGKTKPDALQQAYGGQPPPYPYGGAPQPAYPAYPTAQYAPQAAGPGPSPYGAYPAAPAQLPDAEEPYGQPPQGYPVPQYQAAPGQEPPPEYAQQPPPQQQLQQPPQQQMPPQGPYGPQGPGPAGPAAYPGQYLAQPQPQYAPPAAGGGYPPAGEGYEEPPPQAYAQPPQQPEYAPPPQPAGPPPQRQASHSDCVPLFYYINGDLRDHFYTTNFKELEGGKLHYKFFGVMTGVYATYKAGTIPVYRYYNNFDHDHVYTTDYKKWGKGGSYRTPDGEHGYTYEGVAFYIYKYPTEGMSPVYAFVNPKNGNKIFTMSSTTAGPHSDNFKLQGPVGYAGCTPSANDGLGLSHPGGAGAFGGGPPPMTGGGGPGGGGGGGPPRHGSPIKMPGGGPPDDNVGLMPTPSI